MIIPFQLFSSSSPCRAVAQSVGGFSFLAAPKSDAGGSSFILAQSAPPASLWSAAEHAALIATVFGVLIMWLTYRRKRETRRLEPDPLNVRIASEMVRKEECLRTHNESMVGIHEVRHDLSDMRAQRIIDAKDGAASREKMYQAIKEVRLELTQGQEQMSRDFSQSQEQVRRDLSKGFQDVQRDIGRLEGKINRNT